MRFKADLDSMCAFSNMQNEKQLYVYFSTGPTQKHLEKLLQICALMSSMFSLFWENNLVLLMQVVDLLF